MRRTSVMTFGVLSLILLILLSCGTATMFAGTWADPRYQNASIEKALIIGLFDNPTNRRAFETQVAHELLKRGIGGIPSSDFMPHDEMVNEQTLRKHFKEMDIDAVLLAKFAGADTDRYYTPGSTYVVPTTYYDLYGYYTYGYEYVHHPGYWTETTVVKLETNLYETKDARLIWSGLTETHNPAGALDGIKSLAPVLVSRLVKEGFLRVQ